MHPLGIKRLVAALENPLQVDASRLAHRIRTLTRDRIIGDNYITQAKRQTARRQLADRLANDRREPAGQNSFFVSQFNVAAAVPFPWNECVQNPFNPGQKLLRSMKHTSAVHWAA